MRSDFLNCVYTDFFFQDFSYFVDVFICVLQESNLDQFAGIKCLTNAGFDLVVESIFPDLDDGFEGCVPGCLGRHVVLMLMT